MSYYKFYYQNADKYRKPKAGETIRRHYRDSYAPTDKQQALYNNLLSFLRGKGVDTFIFERVRSKSDCHSKINSMVTTIRKNGWYEEMFGKEETA